MNAQVQTPPTPTGANVITVGCKLPWGLLMEVGRKGSSGYRTHKLNGPNARGVLVVEGFAINSVPADFWKAWLDFSVEIPDAENREGRKKVRVFPNRSLPAVQNGYIYAHEERASVEAHSIDHVELRTGLEPVNPDKLGKGLKTFDPNS